MLTTTTLIILLFLSAGEAAALAALGWFYWRLRRDHRDAVDDVRHEAETSFAYLAERLDRIERRRASGPGQPA